jgi:phenol hydroxylase P5 protein
VATRPRACRAEVTAVRTLNPDVIEVDLRMVEPPALAYAAGQWVSVPFGPKVVRAYSMASAPGAGDALTLSVDVAPGGLGSQWIRGLKPGDAVQFKGPTGGFVVDRADTRRPVFVAEEIGVVPIRSMLFDLYGSGFEGSAALIQWARNPAWLLYEADFRALTRDHKGFSYLPVMREPPPAWRGEKGECHEAVDRLVHSVDRTVVYVCGGEGTIKQVRQALVAKGMDRKSVKWEKFW